MFLDVAFLASGWRTSYSLIYSWSCWFRLFWALCFYKGKA